MKLRWMETSKEDVIESRPRNRIAILYVVLFTPICIVFGILSVNIILAAFSKPQSTSTPSTASGQMDTTKVWEDCGGTPEEARRRNCHFDILSMAWQTHECFDHVTTSAFLAHLDNFNATDVHSDDALHGGQDGPDAETKDVVDTAWKFFLDDRGQNEVPLSVALSGEHQIFVSQEYHYTHCTYMWRQMHRAYAELGYIDSHLANWRHTLHCQKVLLGGMGDKDMIGAVGKVLYPKCIKVGDGSGAAGLVQAGPYRM